MTPPAMSIDRVLWECFRHFAHIDESNAATHTAIVRYSPITFRLAEHLAPIVDTGWLTPRNAALLRDVLDHLGAYVDHGTVRWSEALEIITDVCSWCDGTSEAPKLNSRGERCPCRCHPSPNDRYGAES